MAKAKIITREMMERAMKFTKSNRAAARYLGVCYKHYTKYSKSFRVDELDINSPTLHEIHRNQCGKGIPKFLPNSRKEPNVGLIFKEGIGYESFAHSKIKERGIAEAYFKDECYCCGFKERRVTDYKVPLLLHFIDGNKNNFLIHNLQLYCYNCYFLYVSDPLTMHQKRHIEENEEVQSLPYDWEIDEEQITNMKQLGLWVEDEEFKEPGSEFISYKK
jgi:hypothetical protein